MVKLCKPSNSRSFARRAAWVYLRYLSGGDTKSGKAITNEGYVELRPWGALRDIDFVEGLFRTAIHEFKHVADFQKHRIFADYKRRWENRPHERRAIHATEAAIQRITRDEEKERKIRIDNLMLDLATQLESISKESVQ